MTTDASPPENDISSRLPETVISGIISAFLHDDAPENTIKKSSKGKMRLIIMWFSNIREFLSPKQHKGNKIIHSKSLTLTGMSSHSSIKATLLLLGGLLLTGCGYRAPLYKSYIPEVNDSTAYPGVRAGYKQLAALAEKDTGMKPSLGNTVTVIKDGKENLDMLTEDLRNAQISAYIEPYRFRLDTTGAALKDILQEKAQAGVDIRLILDKSANIRKDRKELRKLRDFGAHVYTFNRPAFWMDRHLPGLATHRDHRKLTILDGSIAYVGSRNIQDKYFFDWHDVDIRVTGPVIEDLTESFRRTYSLVKLRPEELYLAPDLAGTARRDSISGKRQFFDVPMQVVPETPADRKLPIRNCLEWAIGHATDYFWFYNPYTPSPASTIKALAEAARRGVDVRWIVPGVNDIGPEKGMAESMYEELLDAGVRIYEWQEHTMHAKQYLSDDYLMIIGSANLDNLSHFLNYEMVTVLYDEQVCRLYKDVFLSDIEQHCVEVSPDQVHRWTPLHRIRNWLIRRFGGFFG